MTADGREQVKEGEGPNSRSELAFWTRVFVIRAGVISLYLLVVFL